MPHIIVKMYPGRSEQQKARLAGAIVKDVMAITDMTLCRSRTRKSKRTTGPRRSTRPDIVNGSGKLYKKPDTILFDRAGGC